MRYLLLSDIHANHIALEAVLSDAEGQHWDRVLFLGDLVGYYPEPEKAVRLLRDLGPQASLLGNHDQILLEMASGRADFPDEAPLVTELLERQVQELSDGSLAFLRGFSARCLGEGWQAVHGALRQPWEYLDRLPAAQANLPLLERQLCFVGHTHIPKVFASVKLDGNDLWRSRSFRETRSVYRIPPKARLFFNPGSVGQPRDGLPLASYGLFDEDLAVIELRRVEFDVGAVQRSVARHRYPESLASRLAEGR